MKKITLILIAIALFIGAAFAQQPYVTPNTAVNYSFADLVACSNGAVVLEGTSYVMKNDVTISALDSLEVTENITVKIYDGKTLTINGSYWKVDAPTQATFTHYATGEYYATIRIESGSYVRLNNAVFTYGSGIRIIDSDFEMDSCIMNNHNYSSQASGAISTTTGKVIVKNSTFKNNVRSAFNSGANTGTTFEISNCYLENNVTENSNRPQINIGPAQSGEVSKIMNNTILGNRELTMVGGISTSSLLGVSTTYLIEGNTVKDNRYGITFTGSNITGTIKGNKLQRNNTQNSPNLGGSGINITAPGGNTHAIITENIISENLWGITLVGNTTDFSVGPTANLGNTSVPENDPEYNIGRNIFYDNGNEGELYDLYNNNPNDVMAQNNNWGVSEQTEELIRTVIRDSYNNPNYGTVTFMPPFNACKPAKNLNVVYTADCANALLTWEAPAKGYAPHLIFRDGTRIGYVYNETTFTDTGFEYWKPHTWSIVVVCEYGEESIPVEKSLDYCTSPPAATNLSITFSDNCNSAKLTWNASFPFSNKLYNIYRDNELIKENHDITTYSDANFGEGTHTWQVIVIYDDIESAPVSATKTCVLGIEEPELPSFTIIPNPACEEITISATADFYRVEVLNFLGQTVSSQSVIGNSAKLDVSNLTHGVYFVRIASEQGTSVKKFVKQ